MGKSGACSVFPRTLRQLAWPHHGNSLAQLNFESPPQVVCDALLMLSWAAAVYLAHTLLILAKLGPRSPSAGDAAASAVAKTTTAGSGTVPDERAAHVPEGVAPMAVLKVSARHEVALSLAFQGFDLADIARRCDITVAEAKLVATLAESYRKLAHTTGDPDAGRARAAA